ncbi:hypothetical protein [Amycolatopsis nigrescens]|uniref:hypothetical protein n=1 Tax=Amycolatopsis nigrescens TaxID=381445 RepID=UPI000370A678|nr:hypothetical protein [Amycolatopsis nigrescens]
MTEADDPEKLLAQALRAQARSVPQPAPKTARPATNTDSAELAEDPGELPDFKALDQELRESDESATTPPISSPSPSEHLTDNATDRLPPRYGLLSGAGASSLERERAALDANPAFAPAPPAQRAGTTRQVPASHPLAAHWVLVLAVLLGLASGSVIGLLTLL